MKSLNYYHFVLLDCFPFFLNLLTSLIKSTLYNSEKAWQPKVFFFTSKKGQAQKVQRNIPAQSILFIYLFLAVLSLCRCTQAFSSCGSRGCSLVVVCGFLTAVVYHCRSQAPEHTGSVIVVQGLSCPHNLWNLPRPGTEPVSPA